MWEKNLNFLKNSSKNLRVYQISDWNSSRRRSTHRSLEFGRSNAIFHAGSGGSFETALSHSTDNLSCWFFFLQVQAAVSLAFDGIQCSLLLALSLQLFLQQFLERSVHRLLLQFSHPPCHLNHVHRKLSHFSFQKARAWCCVGLKLQCLRQFSRAEIRIEKFVF